MPISQDYIDISNILSASYEEINGYDFYKYIFPDNENQGELEENFKKPNAIYLYEDEKDKGTKRRRRRRIMLADTWEQDYMNYVERNPETLCSGIAYRGRSNKLEHAQQINALIFDLDGVGEYELKNILLRFGKDPDIFRTLPVPTFLVTSGGGVHFYYVFDEPIDLFPNIKLQMKALKYDLTFRIWEYKSTSKQKRIQYQSIVQGFRMVGSINSKYGNEIKAYKTGSKVSLEYLNSYAKERNRVDINKRFRPTKMSRAEAKEKYPEWYQRVVVEKNKNLKKWDIKGKQGYALYNWWLNRWEEIEGGHRYYFLMCLVIYACKCDVPKKKLKEDMYMVYEKLKETEHTNPLTEEDINSAMEVYSKEYYNFKISDIEYLTNLRIERNKRNGRKQSVHIKYMNNQRTFKVELGECTNGGRPKGSGTAQRKIIEWKTMNPDGRKADCIRDTGLSKPTVYKWWDTELKIEKLEQLERVDQYRKALNFMQKRELKK